MLLCFAAFICHHNTFMIYGSLKEPTLNNWSQITHVSVGSAALVSALFAATGYATFTGYTQGKANNIQTQETIFVYIICHCFHMQMIYIYNFK